MFIKEKLFAFGNNFVKNIFNFIVALNKRINVLLFMIGVLAGRPRVEEH